MTDDLTPEAVERLAQRAVGAREAVEQDGVVAGVGFERGEVIAGVAGDFAARFGGAGDVREARVDVGDECIGELMKPHLRPCAGI